MTKEEAKKKIRDERIVHPRCKCCKVTVCGELCEKTTDEELIKYVMEGKC